METNGPPPRILSAEEINLLLQLHDVIRKY